MKVAIDLMHVPSQVRHIRSGPLPDGIPNLLRVAAGDDEAVRAAVKETGRSADILCRAAAFFIEQILFCPDADSYRVLGANDGATNSELRRNMAFLLLWLHPDMDQQAAHSGFARRVTGAWEDLKTPDRRKLYDAQMRRSKGGIKSASRKHTGKSGQKSRRGAQSLKITGKHMRHGARPDRAGSSYRVERISPLRRALLYLLGKSRH
jgi:hypothetical protein